MKPYRPARVDYRTSAFRSKTPQISEMRSARESVDAGAYKPFECSIGGATSVKQTVELSPRKYAWFNRPKTPENGLVRDPRRRPTTGLPVDQASKTIAHSIQNSPQKYSSSFRSTTPRNSIRPAQGMDGELSKYFKYRTLYQRIKDETQAGPPSSAGCGKFQNPDGWKRLLVRNEPDDYDSEEDDVYIPEEPKPSLSKVVENSPRRYAHCRSTTPRFPERKPVGSDAFYSSGVLEEIQSLAAKNNRRGNAYFGMTKQSGPRFRPTKAMYTDHGNIIPGDNDVKKNMYESVKASPRRYAIVRSENPRFEDWKAILKQKERDIRRMQAKEDNLMYSKELITQYTKKHKHLLYTIQEPPASAKDTLVAVSQKFDIASPEVFDKDDLANMKINTNIEERKGILEYDEF